MPLPKPYAGTQQQNLLRMLERSNHTPRCAYINSLLLDLRYYQAHNIYPILITINWSRVLLSTNGDEQEGLICGCTPARRLRRRIDGDMQLGRGRGPGMPTGRHWWSVCQSHRRMLPGGRKLRPPLLLWLPEFVFGVFDGD